MYIIVEGIHDVGKTTFINSLVDLIHLKLPRLFKYHFLKFEGKRSIPKLADVKNNDISNFALGVNYAISWFAKFDLNIIFDRLHLSEYAYSQVIRKYDHNDALHRFQIIDSKLAHENVVLLYLVNDIKIISERMKIKNKNYDEAETSFLLYALNDAYESSNIKKMRIITNETADDLAANVIDWLKL